MGRFSVDLFLANNRDIELAEEEKISAEKVRRLQLKGIVDSGAARLMLPAFVATQLGLESAGEVQVRYADQRLTTRPKVKGVWLKLLGRESVFTAVLEPDREDALIGAIVLEELDLVIDCVTQKLHPRDPNWIISEAE